MTEKVKDIIAELEWRGLICQCSDKEALAARLQSGPIVLYCGFDPTADSLHVGHLLPLVTLRRFQLAGHKPIALVGEGTGLIGDPRLTSERQLNSQETVNKWARLLRAQMEPFLDFKSAANTALLLNNFDWISQLTAIDYLRDLGKHFSVNMMIAKESVRARLEREDGISYTEFSYMILQAYDYLVLAEKHGCELQIGGSDQWGNIVAGMDLVRRRLGRDAYALTLPLILSTTGNKFGKTEQGSIWLDGSKSSPYQLYQFFLNTDDRDVILYLKYFTFLSRSEIDALENELKAAPEKREAQRRLAEEVTRLVHGEKAMRKAVLASLALFGQEEISKLDSEALDMVCRATPFTSLTGKDSIPALLDLLVTAQLATSRSQAKQLVTSGGIYVNNVQVTDVAYVPAAADFLHGQFLVLRKGKKNYHLVRR